MRTFIHISSLYHLYLFYHSRYPKALQFMEELEMPYLNPVNLLDDELDYESGTRSHWNSAGHQKIGSLLSRCIQAFQISQDWSDCEEVETP